MNHTKTLFAPYVGHIGSEVGDLHKSIAAIDPRWKAQPANALLTVAELTDKLGSLKAAAPKGSRSRFSRRASPSAATSRGFSTAALSLRLAERKERVAASLAEIGYVRAAPTATPDFESMTPGELYGHLETLPQPEQRAFYLKHIHGRAPGIAF